MKRKIKFLCVLLFSLLLGACSSHDAKFSYFNMLDAEKRTVQNKRAAEKFWSTVRPVSTLSASHYKLGRYYQEQGKYAKAIEEFSKALRNDSRYCKAYNGIAMCYDALRRYNIAYESYEQAIQCDPQEAYIYNNYGISSLLCGDYEKGLALLLEALQLSGDNNRIRNNLMLAQGIVDQKIKTDQFAQQWEGIPFIAQTYSGQVASEDKQALTNQTCEIPDTLLPLDRQAAGMEGGTFESIEKVIPVQVPSLAAQRPAIGLTAEEKLTLHMGKMIVVGRETATEFASSLEKNIKIVSVIAEKTKKRVVQGQTVAILRKSDGAVEVSNGNGVTGMARKSAAYFRGHDFNVRRITNAKHFRFTDSVIFYREGYLQVAKKLAMVIPGFQEMEKVESLGRATIGVRVLLGKDLVGMQFPGGYAQNVMEYTGPENEYLISSIRFARHR